MTIKWNNLIKTKQILILAVSIIVFSSGSFTAASIAVSQRPKVVIFLLADQFGYNTFSQCADKFQPNGFRQLLDNGANFTACKYSGATNQTACNLSVIATGAYPWSTGVVGNEWYDRRKQKISKPVAIEENSADEGAIGNVTPFYGTTIGDELKILSKGQSRVVSISTAQSDALLLAGKCKDEAFWWDNRSGNFIGVNRISKSAPAWVGNFNSRRYSERFLGKKWITGAEANTIADESFYTRFIGTPWSNQMLFDFAKESIERESLGQDDWTDIVNISFPAFEIVGKNYGSDSQESFELVMRFDQSLTDFLQFLDTKIGLANCLIVFTAAHGAVPSGEISKVQGNETGTIDARSFCNQLDASLSSKLGKANWVEAFTPPNLYLNLSAIDHSTFKQPDVEKLAARLGRSITGVAEIYTAFQFFMNQVPCGPQVSGVQKSYFWGRSGELYVIPKPGFSFASADNGTVCGSPYNYETQVPLIFFGNVVKAGIYSNSVDPADIAPTITTILGANAPQLTEGHILHEAFNWTQRAKYAKPNK